MKHELEQEHARAQQRLAHAQQSAQAHAQLLNEHNAETLRIEGEIRALEHMLALAEQQPTNITLHSMLNRDDGDTVRLVD